MDSEPETAQCNKPHECLCTIIHKPPAFFLLYMMPNDIGDCPVKNNCNKRVPTRKAHTKCIRGAYEWFRADAINGKFNRLYQCDRGKNACNKCLCGVMALLSIQ